MLAISLAMDVLDEGYITLLYGALRCCIRWRLHCCSGVRRFCLLICLITLSQLPRCVDFWDHRVQVGAFHDSAGDARVRQWFVRVLGVPCRIVQQRAGARKVRRPAGQPSGGQTRNVSALEDKASHRPQSQLEQQPSERDTPREPGAGYQAAVEPLVGFANDGQYLLVSEVRLGNSGL